MKRWWLILAVLVCWGGPVAAQETHQEEAGTQAHEASGHPAFKNEVALFLGNTRKSNEDAVTVGLDYARALTERLALALFADYASSQSERDFILGAGLWLEPLSHARILIAGGVEREEPTESVEYHGAEESDEEHHESKTVGLLRVGATYSFHFGSEGRWAIGPQVFLDIVEGNDAWVLGAAVAYLF